MSNRANFTVRGPSTLNSKPQNRLSTVNRVPVNWALCVMKRAIKKSLRQHFVEAAHIFDPMISKQTGIPHSLCDIILPIHAVSD